MGTMVAEIQPVIQEMVVAVVQVLLVVLVQTRTEALAEPDNYFLTL